MTRPTIAATCALLSLACATPFGAAQAEEGWDFRVTPYIWLPSLDIDAGIGPSPPVESSTSLLDVLNAAVLVSFEARKGDIGVIGEFNYLNLSDDVASPGGLISAELGLEGIMTALALSYRAVETERASFDVYGGVRIWSIDTRIDFATLPTAEASTNWVDPIIGLQASYGLTDAVFLDGRTDIGGFGVGSKFQWDALARLGYSFNETLSATLGYRHLNLEFDDKGLNLNGAFTGPLVALDINF